MYVIRIDRRPIDQRPDSTTRILELQADDAGSLATIAALLANALQEQIPEDLARQMAQQAVA